MRELGYSGIQIMVWGGVFMLKGTPQPIIDKFSSELASVMQEPGVQEKLRSTGAEFRPQVPASYSRFVATETERWGSAVRSSGARVD